MKTLVSLVLVSVASAVVTFIYVQRNPQILVAIDDALDTLKVESEKLAIKVKNEAKLTKDQVIARLGSVDKSFRESATELSNSLSDLESVKPVV